MKPLVITHLFLLVSINALPSTPHIDLIKPESLVSGTAKRFGTRSINPRAVLLDGRQLHQLLPRSGDDFITIHRRSGRGGTQGPSRDRARSPSPEKAEVTIMGKGPAKVSGANDNGRMRAFPAVPPGQFFQVDIAGRRKAVGEAKALENTRTGLKGVVAVTSVGHQSAKLNLNAQEGLGRIQRISPPPKDERYVVPFREDAEEIVANPPPRKQELLGSMTGRGTVVAEAKNPGRRAS